MYRKPEISPWGRVQVCDILCPGVFLVSTASHGGTMVSKEVAAFLSPPPQRNAGSGRAAISALRKIHRRKSFSGNCWISGSGKSPTGSETRKRLKKTSTNPSGSTTPHIGGRGHGGGKTPGPLSGRTRPGAKHDNRFGPSWPEVMKGGFELCPMCRFRKIYPK